MRRYLWHRGIAVGDDDHAVVFRMFRQVIDGCLKVGAATPLNLKLLLPLLGFVQFHDVTLNASIEHEDIHLLDAILEEGGDDVEIATQFL